jgi:competence protein ComEA
LALLGAFIVKSGLTSSSTKVEVLSGTTSGGVTGEIMVEVAGEIMGPGVYKLPAGSRVEDLLTLSGGFSGNADRLWTDKYLNRAAKLTDGQKVFIPSLNEQSGVLSAKTSGGDQTVSSTFSSDSNTLININTSSLGELDSLPGIGPVYGQSIIEHRPYSTLEELVSGGAIKQSLYDKIKDRITIY